MDVHVTGIKELVRNIVGGSQETVEQVHGQRQQLQAIKDGVRAIVTEIAELQHILGRREQDLRASQVDELFVGENQLHPSFLAAQSNLLRFREKYTQFLQKRENAGNYLELQKGVYQLVLKQLDRNKVLACRISCLLAPRQFYSIKEIRDELNFLKLWDATNGDPDRWFVSRNEMYCRDAIYLQCWRCNLYGRDYLRYPCDNFQSNAPMLREVFLRPVSVLDIQTHPHTHPILEFPLDGHWPRCKFCGSVTIRRSQPASLEWSTGLTWVQERDNSFWLGYEDLSDDFNASADRVGHIEILPS